MDGSSTMAYPSVLAKHGGTTEKIAQQGRKESKEDATRSSEAQERQRLWTDFHEIRCGIWCLLLPVDSVHQRANLRFLLYMIHSKTVV